MPRSADHQTRNPMEKFNGIALRAAAAGFVASVALMSVWWELGRLFPSNDHVQSSFEAVCILLWPSAILMLGAQTNQGSAALFLLSACLNAGYFVFAVSLLALAIEKFGKAGLGPGAGDLAACQPAGQRTDTLFPSGRLKLSSDRTRCIAPGFPLMAQLPHCFAQPHCQRRNGLHALQPAVRQAAIVFSRNLR